MQPRNTRKAIRELRKLCGEHGISLEVNRSRGAGSHQALIFKDEKTGKAIPLVIAGHDEISPGVQRSTLRYVESLARDKNVASIVRSLAEIVRAILESVFS